jgi:serine/threonine-protein kinase
MLDEATRSFVKRTLAANLVELSDIKKVVVSLLADNARFTPQRLAEGLVGAGLLTRWQAKKLLAGKSAGFYLGSYRLLRPLGKGGMGVVFLGEHHVMKRLMALKVLPAKALADERRIERFKEEARASGQLDHPHIVHAHDFAQTNDKFYIVMEYIDGIDVHQAIRRDGVMSYGDALDVISQAASGLAHAHERGIIHRDIKPSNLLLRTDGVVKISDMGLARVGWQGADDSSSKNRLMGTADFIAPEQAIDSKTVDARADIYSLGCTFFYLLTGRPPFVADSVQQRLAKHQTAPPPNVRSVRSDCPPSIADLIMRMMAKRPEDRPKSAVELVAQLQRIAGRTGIESSLRQSRHVAAASDTVLEEAVYQATIDDSSFPSGEAPLAVAVEEMDFGNLPPIDLSTVATPPLSTPAGNAKQGDTPPRKMKAQKSAQADRQQLLLGIGLALAIVALFCVVGLIIHAFTKPAEQVTPKIRSLEDKQGARIIVVGE